MELIETPTFTKQITALLDDEEYGFFQARLAANPDFWPVIRGSGGLRKARIPLGLGGKRGGGRVVYYWVARRALILLLFAYSKSATADLTPKQVAQLAAIVNKELGNEEGNV